MFVQETKVRVRYAETDQMGYVYYGNYAQYYEVGRVEALRQIGLSYKLLEESGIMMPVLELNCRYHKPARYDDLLTIRTIIDELPGIRMPFRYEVLNQEGVLLNEGKTTLVFISMETQRPVKCPPILYNELLPFFSSKA